ncbi:MAG: TIM barrel protein [Planctomycetota bacterium]
MTKPGIPNELVLSTSCYGPRLRSIEDQAFSAVAMGFRKLELGLSATPPELRGWDDAMRETGITMECLVVGSLKAKGPNMSGSKLGSLDAEQREMALASSRRHIQLAQRLGAPTVILRGCAIENPKTERQAEEFLDRHAKVDSDGLELLQEETREFVRGVLAKAQRQIEHFCRSVHALRKEFPETKLAIAPGNELNDLFGFDAVQWVLDDLSSHKVGYWHDTARIHRRGRLGVHDQGEWLDAFASRTYGVHLRDATDDDFGLPPSLGEVDFKLVAEYMPKDAARVIDVDPTHGRPEVLASVQYLMGLGY